MILAGEQDFRHLFYSYTLTENTQWKAGQKLRDCKAALLYQNPWICVTVSRLEGEYESWQTIPLIKSFACLQAEINNIHHSQQQL